MTLPASGQITMLQIGNEFSPVVPNPYALGSYRGVRWYQDNTATGFFPSGQISMSDFYSKRYNTPVTPSSTTLTGSGTWTVPLYSVLTIVVRGGAGGGAGGQGGNAGLGNPGSGGSGSSFGSGSYGVSAQEGGGGINNGGGGYNGSGSDGSPGGGGGGGASVPGVVSGGPGGAGGRSVLTVFNPISGNTPVGPPVGAGVGFSCGGGGPGGGGSAGFFCNPFPYCTGSNGGNGAPGGNGFIQLFWS